MILRLFTLGIFACSIGSGVAADTRPLLIELSKPVVVVRTTNGAEFTRYLREKPAGSPSKSESAAYFHPFTTPKGLVLTDVGPDDHRHHRGIFFAWVNMQGATPADFWGWGALASTEGRRIVNREVKIAATGGFTAQNEWIAGDQVVLREELRAQAGQRHGMNVLDVDFRLTPQIDITLPKTAFSGFCVRVPKSARIIAYEPSGPARYPAPQHDKPATGWPDRSWYAYTLELPEGRGGVAVMNHPANPPTLWHNLASIGMINPCIHAAASVELKRDQPLRLRYLVVGFDGDVPTAALDAMALDWGK